MEHHPSNTLFIHTLPETTPPAYVAFLQGLADNLDSPSLVDLSQQLQDHELQGKGIPSLLSMSFRYHRWDVAEVLLKRDIDVNHRFLSNQTYDAPLTALLEAKFSLLNPSFIFSNLPEGPDFTDASSSQKDEVARIACLNVLLDKGAQTDIRDIEDTTLITLCLYMNGLSLAKILVNHGVDPLIDNFENDPPLRAAVLKGDFAFCQWLVEQGADVNDQDDWGNSVISAAIHADNVPILAWLIEKGALMQNNTPFSDPWKMCRYAWNIGEPPQRACFDWLIDNLPWAELEEDHVLSAFGDDLDMVHAYRDGIAKRQKREMDDVLPVSQNPTFKMRL